jgi:GNAT superfamily N-acetyltransferase
VVARSPPSSTSAPELAVRRELDGGYVLDDDTARIDVDAVVAYLTTEAYWSTWRVRDQIAQQISCALNVGLYAAAGEQVGYARTVTDGVSLAYLADVYVLAAHRGRGLGLALVDFTLEHGPSWRWLLHTRDAGGLYARFGFAAPPANLMERPGTTQ